MDISCFLSHVEQVSPSASCFCSEIRIPTHARSGRATITRMCSGGSLASQRLGGPRWGYLHPRPPPPPPPPQLLTGTHFALFLRNTSRTSVVRDASGARPLPFLSGGLWWRCLAPTTVLTGCRKGENERMGNAAPQAPPERKRRGTKSFGLVWFVWLGWLGLRLVCSVWLVRSVCHPTQPNSAATYNCTVPQRTLYYCTVPQRTLYYCTVPQRTLYNCTVPQRTLYYCTVPQRILYYSKESKKTLA
eukprot:gene8370-biopygen1593